LQEEHVANITVKEIKRQGTRVLVVTAAGYERWVDAADWDADSQAVAAQIADYLNATVVPPPVVITAGAKTVTLTSAEVEAKLADIAAVKAAAEAVAEVPAEDIKG
jgi:hypothetical protein